MTKKPAERPSLGRLLEQTTGRKKAAPAAPRKQAKKVVADEPFKRRDAEIVAQARRVKVRAFVRAMLTPGRTFMNAAGSYREVMPGSGREASAAEGHRMLQQDDVKAEMSRQLRAIDKAADLDDQWVYDRWRMIANANIVDYLAFDDKGRAQFDLQPDKLTLEQQLVIREVRIDPRTGKVTRVKLASIDEAVANVARARQMIHGKRDLSSVDLAQRIAKRMQQAAKKLGRTFDEEGNEL